MSREQEWLGQTARPRLKQMEGRWGRGEEEQSGGQSQGAVTSSP